MERLTKYRDDIEAYDMTGVYAGAVDEMCQKLGKIEDLEEQIGCPLNVYMQIEMDRVDGLYDEKGNFWKFNYMTYRRFRCYRKNDKDEEIDKTFDVNGYKKTWFLKEDKSE